MMKKIPMIAFLSAAERPGLGDPVVVVAPFMEQVTSWWGVNSRHMACVMAFTSLVSCWISALMILWNQNKKRSFDKIFTIGNFPKLVIYFHHISNSKNICHIGQNCDAFKMQ
jgi:hypothetical protein